MNQQLYFGTDVEGIRNAQVCCFFPRLYFDALDVFLFVEFLESRSKNVKSVISLFTSGNGL